MNPPRERHWFWRALLLVAVSVVCATAIVDWSRAPSEELVVGDIAPRTIKAPVGFKYQDLDAYEESRREAEESELPVFVHQSGVREDTLINVRMAFANARALIASAEGASPGADASGLRHTVQEQFTRDLRVHLVADDVEALFDEGFTVPYEELVAELLGEALTGTVVADRADLPRDGRAIRVIELGDESADRIQQDLDGVLTAEDVRQRISLRTLNSQAGRSPGGKAAAGIARSLVRANLSYSPLKTEERRQQAVREVRLQPQSVKRGTVLFREGDTLSQRHILLYEALQAQQGEQATALEWGSIATFLMLLLGISYSFGASYMDRFDTRFRNLASTGALLVLVIVMARITVAASEGVASLVGYEAEAQSVWFVVPVAGAVMLVRLLMGVSWSVIFTLVASITVGLVMDMAVLPVAFFLISGLTAAASVSQTRERIAVLRAGLQVALVNAATVLVIHFVQLYVIDGEVTLATTMRPVWSMMFALSGGIASAFLVLGLTPLFESLGFVTDYRLMELANLNHPLMRQLMLRAPGSYHHSVMVGSLSEAAAEAIGANALQSKVSAYFHDIGKALKPQYFVENQGKGGNRHDGLDPHTSAQIIISHVTEGGRMAAEHKLPRPIQDNIWMHHGTGLLQYFYSKAAEQPGPVDEAAFRYPGPKPSNREAGVIMLADKVEAATRTIRTPTEDNIRLMISKIVSSVMADGQFSECPLTFQEIHTIADTFVTVLLGIYHQRIEYPQTADVSRADAPEPMPTPRPGLITLELPTGSSPPPGEEPVEPLPPPLESPIQIAQGHQKVLPGTPPPSLRRLPGEGDELPPPVTVAPQSAMGTGADYESVQHLPRGRD